MKNYLRLRRWVDRDLATQHRPISIFGPLFLVIFALIGAHFTGPVADVVAWALILPLAVGWSAFVTWRVWRLLRAVSIKGDRAFDQRDKYFLSAEYHRSESVTAASQHKRSQRRRAQVR